MQPRALWWLIDSKQPKRVFGFGKFAMAEDEAAEIYNEAYGS